MSKPTKIIVFDTETTGFSPEKNEIVQLSYILYDTQSQTVIHATKQGDDIVKIDGNIPKRTTEIHGIQKYMTLDKRPIKYHIDDFIYYFSQADKFVGHNISFDIKMIVGQIKKIITKLQPDDEDIDKYSHFLNKFQMVGTDLPDTAFCTMNESKGICAEIRGTTKLKKEKLMEVHKLLFNQDVRGQLHNALVDISVTLRVFLKLTMDIDICKSISKIGNVINVTNNNEICNLINPIDIYKSIENIDYNGELITGITVLPDGLEEDKIMVKSIYTNMAKTIVKDVQNKAMQNILNREPSQNICTSITICRSILKSGAKKGQECMRPFDICPYHNKPKIKKQGVSTLRAQQIAPSDSFQHENTDFSNLDKKIAPQQIMKPETRAATSFVKNIFTKKNKVAPIGGKTKNTKRKNTKRKNTKRKNTKRKNTKCK